jgi:hypothetical protein
MPYLVTCPNCGSKLKTSQPVPAGRSLTCPQCKAGFTLSEPAPAMDAPAAAPAPRPAPSPSRAAASPAPSARVERPAKSGRDEDNERPRSRRDADDERPRSRRRDDEEDDRPRRRRDEDDEDDRPRRRRRPTDEDVDEDRPKSRRPRDDEDHEDDRPKSRRPRDEDEDEDRPRSRRRVDDDEDEERPKARKGRDADDDEDEDDRPRRRGRAKKSKKGPVLILGGLAALFVLFVVGGLIMYFADPFGLFGGGASSEMLAWAPSDSQALIYMDIEGMEKVDEMKANIKGEVVDQVKLGLKPEEVSAVLGAGRAMGDAELSVIRLRAKADQQKLIAACGGKEATANGKKYYKSSGGGGLYFASDRLLVVTKNEAVMTAALQKENKVTISDDLRAVSKSGEGLMWMAASGPAAEKGDMIGLMAGFGNLMGGFGVGGPPAPKSTPPKAKATLLSIKASGSRGTGRFESTYDSPETAKRMADDLRKIMEQAKTKSKDMESFDISTSGSTVVLTIVGPVKSGKAGLPGLPIGPGGGF